MRRLDALIVKELFGPWAFGVAIFTVLIMAGTYLFKITEYIVGGAGASLVVELSLLLLPGIMAKTFPMAMLLAALLAFGRLSGDSEIVAMRATGASLPRMMLPVGLFGVAVAALAFAVNELLVPSAALRATALQERITAALSGTSWRTLSYPVYDRGVLKAMVGAQNFEIGSGRLQGAYVIAYDARREPSYVLFADRLVFTTEDDWKIEGPARLLSADGSHMVRLENGAWPTQVPRIKADPKAFVAATLRDLDALSMRQMHAQIETAKQNPTFDPAQIANLEYGYFNKIALPAAAIVYALVGAPLGIRSHRTSAASGFWLSVLIIFCYISLANLMNIFAQGGRIHASVASFTPLVIGLLVAGFAIWRKN